MSDRKRIDDLEQFQKVMIERFNKMAIGSKYLLEEYKNLRDKHDDLSNSHDVLLDSHNELINDRNEHVKALQMLAEMGDEKTKRIDKLTEANNLLVDDLSEKNDNIRELTSAVNVCYEILTNLTDKSGQHTDKISKIGGYLQKQKIKNQPNDHVDYRGSLFNKNEKYSLHKACKGFKFDNETQSYLCDTDESFNTGTPYYYAQLYIVQMFDKSNNDTFYKIGFTVCLNVLDRFNHDDNKHLEIKLIYSEWDKYHTIVKLEKLHQSLNANYHYTPIQSFGGSIKECFSKVSINGVLWQNSKTPKDVVKVLKTKKLYSKKQIESINKHRLRKKMFDAKQRQITV